MDGSPPRRPATRTRRLSVVAALAVALVLSLLPAEASAAQGSCIPGFPVIGCPPAPQPPPPTTTPTPGGGGGGGSGGEPDIPQRDFVGIVSEDAFGGDSAYRTATFPLHRGLGIGTIRQAFLWSSIERAKGRFDFGYTDGFVADAARHGVTVLPVLFGTPKFRSSKPRRGALRGAYPPRRPSDFAAFATAAVRRYGPSGSFWAQNPSVPQRPIRSWQIWNEPNLPVYWRPSPSTKGYVQLLSAASRAIKRVDRRAEIVTGGLPQSASGVPLKSYIAAMYKAGGKRAFDTLAVHPYGATSGEVLRRVTVTRATMNRFGDRKAKIWVTELGWADVGPGSRFTVGIDEQAARIRTTITALWNLRVRLRLRGFVYFNWRDSLPYAGGRDFWGLHTGLMDLDGRNKPAYEAFRSVVSGLR